MIQKALPQLTVADVFITDELDRRAPKKTDYLQEKTGAPGLGGADGRSAGRGLAAGSSISLLASTKRTRLPAYSAGNICGACLPRLMGRQPRGISARAALRSTATPRYSRGIPSDSMAGSLTLTSSYPRFCSYRFI